jgi:hypothetical protein
MSGIETLLLTAAGAIAPKALEKATEKLSEIVIQSVWKESGGWLSKAKLNETIAQQIFVATRQYVENYAERHGILKVLGMREPVSLESIYTNVQFLGRAGVQLFASIDSLEAAYRETQRRRFQPPPVAPQDGLKIANEQPFLMVLGQPGAGKSTFLRRMGLEALKGKGGQYQPQCIPVLIELKRFTTNEIDLEPVIIQELTTCGFPKATESAQKLLQQGKLLIILDGLDEVPTPQLDQAITQIQDFVDRYDQNRFIASCRTAAYRSSFKRFFDVVIADFDEEQIQQFIRNWFQSAEDQRLGTAQLCWERLQQPDYAATKELAQTPILLTLLCLVFDDSQMFPKNRATLYGEALDVLLKKWAAEKRIQRDPIYKDLGIEQERMMLAEIAYTGFFSDRLFFSVREVTDQIRTFLASNLNAPKHLDSEVILEAIQVQQGILVERARDVLSFSHLTLQEYLTAQHMADHNLIEALVNRPTLTDPRWRETWQLVAGLMRGGADDLLLRLEQQTHPLIDTDKLKNLIHWADQATVGSGGNFKPAAKRSLAIFLARDLARDLARNLAVDLDRTRTPALALALDFACALDRGFDLACARARARYRGTYDRRYNVRARDLEFENLNIFNAVDFAQLTLDLADLKVTLADEQQPIEVRQATSDRVWQTWYDALHINPDWLDLAPAEITALQDYFYINELLIRCKAAAIRVTPATWAGIETRMLAVVS